MSNENNKDCDCGPAFTSELVQTRNNDINVSFEFFPPKDDKSEAALWRTVKRLEPLAPSFVSVTYGAGGTTRDRTHAIVKRIVDETSLKPAAHLTCVAATQEEVDEVAQGYLDAGINHVVALRGDPPDGAPEYTPHPGGYDHAVDLVKGLKTVGDFEISVAAYPELHPDAPDAAFDMDNLKRKIDAGATRAITQFFFETETFLRFVDRVRAAGIDVPIVPGILPVTNFSQVVRFSKMCGATIPVWMHEIFEGLDEQPDSRKLLAAMVASEQCRSLVANGIKDIHFYTLNRAELSYAICLNLGLRPVDSIAA
jgi:methylenetetrahydrofolate reductase (NADPH)